MTELTEDQKKFLQECEQEFAGRFTEADKEFMAHCERPTQPPPILDDWMNRGGNSQRERGRYQGNYQHRNNYNRHHDGQSNYRDRRY